MSLPFNTKLFYLIHGPLHCALSGRWKRAPVPEAMPNVRCSAVFFWCAALAAGNLDPPSFGGGRAAHARVGVGAGGRLPGAAHAHAQRRAWQPDSTVAASSCASEPWMVNTSDLTVTAEYLGLLRSCPGSVSGAETKAPTARLLVNSTFRITPGGGGAPRPAPRAPRPAPRARVAR
jgi:hypothetical protein